MSVWLRRRLVALLASLRARQRHVSRDVLVRIGRWVRL